MTVPLQCRPIANRIASLEFRRRRLQEELRHAAPQDKPGIIAEIREINAELRVANDELAECVAQTPPPPPPLAATFTGTATIAITNPQVPPAPMSAPMNAQVVFNGERTSIHITSLAPIISPPFDTPIGTNVTTISLVSGGAGSYSNGDIAISLTLLFDHSIDIILFEEDSTLPLLLRTAPPGSPLDPAGNVILAGSGTFQGGFLNGSPADVRLTGLISPHP
jgi:hypothetical protein